MGPRVADTGTLTTVVLALIALFAVVTLLGIVRGMRLKRQRAEAERVERDRIEAEGGVQAEDAVANEHAPLTDDDATDIPAAARDQAPDPVAAPVPAAEPAPSSPVASDEPIAAAAPLAASPASEAAPEPADAPAPPPASPPPAARPALDNEPLTRLKGLGPKVAERLTELGFVNIGDMAALDDRAAQDLDARLGPFTGRMARDRWLEQARLLAAGDVATFEERFGKL